jgi:hypothetical protein
MYKNGCIAKFIRKCLTRIVLDITHDNFATFFYETPGRACTKPACGPRNRSNFSLYSSRHVFFPLREINELSAYKETIKTESGLALRMVLLRKSSL